MELTGVHLLPRYLLLDRNLISGEGYTLFEDAYIVRGLVFPSLLRDSRVLIRGDGESLAWARRGIYRMTNKAQAPTRPAVWLKMERYGNGQALPLTALSPH